MNPNARRDDFDSLMADWFDRDAQVRPPEQLLAATLERTTRTRPLPTWRLPERWLHLDTLAIRRPAVPRIAPLLIVIALLVLAFAAALILGVGARKLPAPIGPAANGRIAYIAGGQVYTASSSGTDVHQLTTGSLKTAMAFSNDGTKLAYKSALSTSPADDLFLSSDLVIADADGSHARVLVANARGMSNPAWSPDGTTIAISTFGTGPGATDRLKLVAVDATPGAGLRDLGAGFSPTWSPDGQLLAVSRGTELWIVSRDGTTSRRISQGTYSPDLGEAGGAAVWSPDGTHLLFGAGDPANVYPLFIVGLDGAPERTVALDGGDAVWSPDGSRIAYMQNGTGTGPSLVIADSTGKKIRVFPGQYAWKMPIWSPDGTKVAITDDRPGPDNIPGPPVTVILEVVGNAAPVILPGVYVAGSDAAAPDFSATWQRLAP
ncbi:MAG TPA: hypothetical protein VKC59_02715 [Candidatus Limnocylindrales bacterium]|nr:hypothetical protein [Candidatus Limnocylindrales bacterium]